MIACNGLWQRVKAYLDSLPDNEVKTGWEVANAVGSSRASLNGNLDYSHPEIESRSVIQNVAGQNGTPNRRMYGNPRAIRKLKEQLRENKAGS